MNRLNRKLSRKYAENINLDIFLYHRVAKFRKKVKNLHRVLSVAITKRLRFWKLFEKFSI